MLRLQLGILRRLQSLELLYAELIIVIHLRHTTCQKRLLGHAVLSLLELALQFGSLGGICHFLLLFTAFLFHATGFCCLSLLLLLLLLFQSSNLRSLGSILPRLIHALPLQSCSLRSLGKLRLFGQPFLLQSCRLEGMSFRFFGQPFSLLCKSFVLQTLLFQFGSGQTLRLCHPLQIILDAVVIVVILRLLCLLLNLQGLVQRRTLCLSRLMQ
mmetsp:Transcript_18790/g.29098  ORF Transcript_18790/g.29098 Transcript_18790/m.29098 type:complete len:213 (+) Transcript_18790:594-1232(+)